MSERREEIESLIKEYRHLGKELYGDKNIK